jgi:hypothetical protein
VPLKKKTLEAKHRQEVIEFLENVIAQAHFLKACQAALQAPGWKD